MRLAEELSQLKAWRRLAPTWHLHHVAVDSHELGEAGGQRGHRLQHQGAVAALQSQVLQLLSGGSAAGEGRGPVVSGGVEGRLGGGARARTAGHAWHQAGVLQSGGTQAVCRVRVPTAGGRLEGAAHGSALRPHSSKRAACTSSRAGSVHGGRRQEGRQQARSLPPSLTLVSAPRPSRRVRLPQYNPNSCSWTAPRSQSPAPRVTAAGVWLWGRAARRPAAAPAATACPPQPRSSSATRRTLCPGRPGEAWRRARSMPAGRAVRRLVFGPSAGLLCTLPAAATQLQAGPLCPPTCHRFALPANRKRVQRGQQGLHRRHHILPARLVVPVLIRPYVLQGAARSEQRGGWRAGSMQRVCWLAGRVQRGGWCACTTQRGGWYAGRRLPVEPEGPAGGQP